MKTTNFLKVILLTSCLTPLLSCNNSEKATDEEYMEGKSVDDAKLSGDYSNMDQEEQSKFLQEAESDGRMEIRMAQIAQKESGNKDVLQLAQMIEKDHKAANQQLMKLAQTSNVQLKDTILEKHQLQIDELETATTGTFDQKYVQMMIDGHQKAISKFEDTIKQMDKTGQSSTNSQIKGWASETLPVLRKHLKHSKEVLQQLNAQ